MDFGGILWNQISLLGSTIGTGREFGEMLDRCREGGFRPVVDKVFPLADAAQLRYGPFAGRWSQVIRPWLIS